MALAPFRTGRLAIEAQGAWGTAASTFATGTWLEAEVAVPTPVQEALQTDTMRGGFYESTVVAGSKAGMEVSLRMPLHGFSTASPSADPTAHPDAVLLASVLGASALNGYAASDITGGTASQLEYTASSAVAAHEGHALMVAISGGYSIGWATSVTTSTPDTIDLIEDLSAVPTGSGAVYGSNVCYLSTTQPTPFSLLWLGADGNSKITFFDGVVTSAKLALNPKGQPMMECTCRFANWTNAGTGGAPGDYVYTDRPQMPAALGANGARYLLAGAAVNAATFEVEVTAEVSEAPGHAADQGVAQYVVTNRTVRATVQVPASDLSTINAPGTSGGTVQLDLSTTSPGRALSILMPLAQRQELETLGDAGGIVALTTVFGPSNYAGDDTSTAPANTDFRVAFL
jgi:hypothetical protein